MQASALFFLYRWTKPSKTGKIMEKQKLFTGNLFGGSKKGIPFYRNKELLHVIERLLITDGFITQTSFKQATGFCYDTSRRILTELEQQKILRGIIISRASVRVKRIWMEPKGPSTILSPYQIKIDKIIELVTALFEEINMVKNEIENLKILVIEKRRRKRINLQN